MRFLNAKARITLGLVGLLISMTMLAFFLQIIPDRHAADIERRTALSETVAVYSTALVKTARAQRLKDDFELLISRNNDLLSLALRRENSSLLVATDKHVGQWQEMIGDYSSNTQVKVPIYAGEDKWGQLEIRFKPLSEKGFWGILQLPIVQLVLFLGIGCFLIYYFYLGQVLRQLDPSQAVPGRVRSALDTMAEGLLILDRKEQIVLANQAFSSMVGKPAEELMGFRAGELPWLDSDDQPVKQKNRPWVLALVSGKLQRDCTIRLRLSDSSTRTFKTNCSPVLGEKEKYAGVLVSFDDITELEQKEVELIKSKREAEEANLAKSSFLANMSHEIRTPMNAILGFTEILKRGYVKNEQESLKYLNTIHSSGQNLLALINDILDLSKVEAGHLEVEKIPVEPYAIISEVVQILQVKAAEKCLQLTFNAATAVPAQIETDPVRLRQIAFNLIGNSIKFTEQGQVDVSCRYEKFSGKSWLMLDIVDTGIGMDEVAQKNIFNPFVQADSTVTRRFGGTGLGLAISRKFAQAMGGDISVQSEVGKGSLFSVSLLCGDLSNVELLTPEQVLALQQPEAAADCSSWQLPESRVLVVDDGMENRDLVQLLLESAGVQVDQAENGQIGVDMATANRYDVILMDVNMPVMDGFTAAGLLRKQNQTMPIVALTANAMVGFESDCLAAGYSDYLSKPIHIDRFMEKMVALLGGSKVAAAPRSAETLETVEIAADSSPLVSTLPTHNEKFQKIVIRFVERLQEQLTALASAVGQQDFTEIANLAHWLKGAGGTVGFDAFTEPATKLEEAANGQLIEEVQRTVAQIEEMARRITTNSVTAVTASTEAAPQTSVAGVEELLSDNFHEPIKSRLAGNQRLQKIIVRFVTTLHDKIEAMQRAVEIADFVELAALAHWLKGSAGTVGFDTFTQPAIELETAAGKEHLATCQQYVRVVKQMSLAVILPEILNTEG